MRSLHLINQTTAFLLELVMLVVAGRWAYIKGNNSWVKYTVAAVTVLVIVLLWGYFAAPKSAHRLSSGYLAIFKLLLFAVTTAMLYQLGYTSYAIVFALVAIANVGFENFFRINK